MFLLFFLPIVLHAGFSEDLNNIVQQYDCDPQCTFNHSEVTSETMKFFPRNCSNICGILIINSNTDLSEENLEDLFKLFKELRGGIRIVNSNLTSLQFLPIENFHVVCNIYGMVVANNRLLTDVSVLGNFQQISEEGACKLLIENNTALDTRWMCKLENFYFYVDLETRGNLKDCTCKYNSQLQPTKSCKIISGGLNLTGIMDLDELSFLKNIDVVLGNIEIGNTNLKNISFLRNLKVMQSFNGKMNDIVSINIHDNYEMTRLGFKNLLMVIDMFKGPFILNLENLNPDFCMTFYEWRMILENQVELRSLHHAKTCRDSKSIRESGTTVCDFKSVEILEMSCEILVGDVVIDANDGLYFYKLKYIWCIFGTLKIQYMKADGLEFLTGLAFIVSLDEEKTPVTIRSNKHLRDARLPNILHIISENHKEVVLYDNPVLFENNEQCRMYRLTYRTNVAVENRECEKSVYKASYLPNLLFNSSSTLLILIVTIYF